MIKGLLKSVFILGLILLPVSFSNAISQDYYSPFTIISRCLYEVDYTISNNGSFSSYYNGLQKNNLLYFKGSDRNDCSLQQYIVLGRKNGRLYLFTRNGGGVVNQGYLNYYCYGSEPCGTMNVSSGVMLDILNNQGVKGLYLSSSSQSAVFSDDGFNQYHQACLLTNSETTPYLCFYAGYPSNYLFSDSLSFNVSDWDSLSSFDGFFDNSPISYNGNSSYTPGETYTVPTDLDRYIEYYEIRFGRNKNMCYVGTNDFTSVYGSGGSFEVGTGLTLNELYYKLYGTFGSNNIKNVGSFVNSWLINYSQWFYAGKQYTVNYNGPDTNITVNYDNITFPFANKPVAIYFMASNLFDYYSIESTQGEEMVYYCQMKINYTYYKDNPDRFKEEVEDKVGSGVNERVQQYYNSQIVNNGTGKVGFQIPNLTGTLWGEVSSGNVLPEDLNPTNLFKDFFTKVTTLTETYSPSQNGILPDWIVYPLIFLVLFRIFKH